MRSQNKKILKYLKSNNSIDAIQALNMFECFRLAARIGDLKNAGHKIISKSRKKNGKRYSEYRLAD